MRVEDLDDIFAQFDLSKPFTAEDDRFELNVGQQSALETIIEWLGLPKHTQMRLALTGPAGSGKTVLLRRVRDHAAAHGMQIMWAAMTGKAASRVNEAVGVPCTTLHRLLYGPPQVDEKNGVIKFETLRRPPYESALVIDESSMITPQVYKDLNRWVTEFAVRILFVGDGFQLPPVISEGKRKGGDDPPDYSVFSEVGGPALTEVMRNGDSILEAATMLRQHGRLPTKSAPRPGYELRSVKDPLIAAVETYLDDMDDHALITWTNRARMTANQIIRARLGVEGERPQPGEPILIRRNQVWNDSVVLNGEVYTVGTIEPGDWMGPVPTVHIVTTCGRAIFAHAYSWSGDAPYLADKDEWKLYRRAIDDNIRKLYMGGMSHAPEPIPVTYGHVLTCHAAQGSEFRRATVFLPKLDHRSSHFRKPTVLPDGTKVPFGVRFLYTALTRAKERATLIVAGG